ncbi:shikimate dehydrogenase [Microbacteriaceae bacterium MWH-Ta3]|nr:shikimate dehydrogenase [Microbacteriaceae bacterium MWH-Ta3]
MSDSFEVWGSPIAHSLSPTLHRAAFAALGRDWTYNARDVPEAEFDAEWAARSTALRGLSLTMPLKECVIPYLGHIDEVSGIVGAVNTVRVTAAGALGFNTDVWGAEQAMRDVLGDNKPDTAVMLGAGATARSCAVALRNLGVRQLDVVVRTPARASELVALAEKLGIAVTVHALDLVPPLHADIAVNTIPHGSDIPQAAVTAITTEALFDVVYANWPTDLAREWASRGATVVSGLSMLAWQALRQQRIFAHHDPEQPLSDETRVFAAMCASVGLERPQGLKG